MTPITPISTRCALQSSCWPGMKERKFWLLVTWPELGEFGRQCHEEVGEFAKNSDIDALYSCGVLTQFSQSAYDGEGEHFSNQQQLIKKLKQEAKAGTTILVKGSRSSHMEKVVLALMENSDEQNESIALNMGED